jgi:hypothetical protein
MVKMAFQRDVKYLSKQTPLQTLGPAGLAIWLDDRPGARPDILQKRVASSDNEAARKTGAHSMAGG